ncbi:MAG: hypothetical protein CL581_07740 [Alteromonadaceae bacterium]|nr:hypothetical protein [Alteromonadaceae bacterium]MBH84644.1 hypothetical protein [Alteromonadaceae bacterium]
MQNDCARPSGVGDSFKMRIYVKLTALLREFSPCLTVARYVVQYPWKGETPLSSGAIPASSIAADFDWIHG